MKDELLLECPKNKILDIFVWIFTFHTVFLALFIILSKVKLKIDIKYFMVYVAIYSVVSIVLLSNMSFRNYTKMVIKKDDEVHFYSYGGISSRLDLMFSVDNIQKIRARESIFGLMLEITLCTNNIWSISRVNKEKINRKIIISDEMLDKLKQRLIDKDVEWEISL